jgi:hypothetical protein
MERWPVMKSPNPMLDTSAEQLDRLFRGIELGDSLPNREHQQDIQKSVEHSLLTGRGGSELG